MKPKPTILLVLAFLLRLTILLAAFATLSASGTMRYVDVNNASPYWPYTSWDIAATTIQDAVDAADPSDEIVVTNGTYATGGRAAGTNEFGPNLLVNRVAVDKPLTVRSVNGPQFTIIRGYQVPGTTNGDAAIRCVYLANGSSLSGFTLTNGATRQNPGDINCEQSGGGVWCESTNVVVTNCVLAGNSAPWLGGGAYLGTLNNCTLTGNWAHEYGGGAFGGMLNNCTLTGNSASSFGGGADACTLNNCTLTGNYAGSGGGVESSTLKNCILTGNSASSYGGGADACTLNNCTLTGNSAAGSDGGGGVAGCTLNNCIVYYNTAMQGANYGGLYSSTLNYSCTTPLPAGGVGNLDAEPQLASAFRLSANSPCLGKGNYASVSGVDIDGEPWVNPPAIGCDEYYTGSLTGAVTVAVLASYTNVAAGFSVDFQGSISGRVSASRWEFGEGTVVSNRPYVSHSWIAAGDYPVVLRAYNNSNPGGVTTTVMVHVVTQPVHYVALGNATPAAPYNSWATAATNIQNAVDASSVVGALVLVSNGVYATGGRAVVGIMTNRVAVTKPAAVRSVNGPEFTVIRGYQVPGLTNGAGAIRCVYLTNGASLSGFTLTNGATVSSADGGGVWCESGAIVSNCVLVGNSASSDGGGAWSGTLNNCTLTGNSVAQYYGGGVSCGTLNNCILTGNCAGWEGGGAYSCTLNNCTLTGNNSVSSGYGSGGGAYSSLLNNCTLSGNKADIGGGAYGGTLYNCTLTGNSARYSGGGAYGGTLYNCTLTSNSSKSGGGAQYATLYNCTLTGNSASNYGGGAYAATLNNCTVIGNSAILYGGGVATEPKDPYCDDCVAHPCTLTNCIVYFNTAPTGANYDSTNLLNYCCTTPLPATGVGNITSAPLFVDYSGGNLRLQSNSPCINAGNNAYVVGSTDLDGRPRIVSGTVDMGAYEFQPGVDSLFLGWLQHYGLPTDGSADYTDADGDGLNNWQEWRCWTDPTNAASVLKLQTPVFTPPGVLLRWSSDSSHTYGVERATSLTPPVAFSLLQSDLPGLSPATTFTDTSAPLQGAAFYRIRADATNPSLPLVLQAPLFVPASLTLCWSSVTNRTYVLERSTNLAQPAFSTLQSNITGQAGTTSYTDTNAIGNGPFFYRVGVQQ